MKRISRKFQNKELFHYTGNCDTKVKSEQPSQHKAKSKVLAKNDLKDVCADKGDPLFKDDGTTKTRHLLAKCKNSNVKWSNVPLKSQRIQSGERLSNGM